MKLEAPEIDKRKFSELFNILKDRAAHYTPEWTITDEKIAGFALLNIFAHMQEEIITRLNRVPDKNFTAFLEMLGIKLMPAQPAKAPVTFYLSEGLTEGAFVPVRTQVAAEETEKHKALTFETINGFFATPAVIEEVFCVGPDNDAIYNYTDDFKNKKEFKIFVGDKDLQEHVLYLGHNELFNLKNAAEIKLKFSLSGSIESLVSLTWEYWGEDDENPQSFSVSKEGTDAIVLTKGEGEIKKKKINGIENRWIHCRAEKVTKKSVLPVITSIKIKDVTPAASISPDLGFYNSIPLDLTSNFYPFGRQPRLFDTFYFANSDAFSKKNADITITISAHLEKTNPTPVDVQLSWEYWNGSVWRAIEGINSGINFSSNVTINFDCPDDLKEIEVNGEKNYWIRVRLVNGNYGKDEFEKETDTKWKVTPNFNPPVITSITIAYSFTNKIDLQHCLAYNNLEYRNFTNESKSGTDSFKPFMPLLEEKPALFLGFNNPFKKGNISIFFSLAEKDTSFNDRQKLQWTYWSKSANLVEDMTQTDKVKLVSVAGISKDTELLFEETSGAEIIAEIAKVKSILGNSITLEKGLSRKYTRNASIYKKTYLELIDNTEYLTKSGTLEFIGPSEQFKTHKFGKDSYWLMGTLIETGNIFEPPLIKGIYPNTVWAEQIETIKDEILGSSEGEKNSKYKFNRLPVISQEIWIMEGETIHREERETLGEEDIHEIKDEKGKVIETWVKWKAVDDFMNSGPRDRHYMIDNAMGDVQFGDGEKGMIPPIGKDNIKANYKSGGGVQGNVGKNEISALKSSVAGIDHVINHEPAEGGADTELINEVFERGPHLIKHRDKAVTKEDFERLAKAASSYIARTKCFIEGAYLNVIIIPKGEEDRPYPSLGLRNIVRKYLLERSLNTILNKSLDVVEPSYKEVKVIVDVIPESIDLAVPLEKEILRQLKEYLHPLTGGNDKSGWEFGRGVHISDVYALLESINGVHHVEGLLLNSVSKDVEIKESETVCSGEHRITMKLGS